jgi:SNF2 family DNA or RNA helicase
MVHKLDVKISKDRAKYRLMFSHDTELVNKIRNTKNAKYDNSQRSWSITALSLMKVIESYRGRNDIFFRFETDALKGVFLTKVKEEIRVEEERIKHEHDTLENYKKWVAYKKWLEENTATLPVPDAMNKAFTPFPHQLVGAYLLNETKSGMMALEMGLGKTMVSIMYVEMQGEIDGKVLVITPNFLKYNYLSEVEKFTNAKAYVYKNKKTKKGIKEELEAIKEAKYIIINYEYFSARPTPSDKKKILGNINYFNYKTKITDLGLDKIWGVICDESHYLKNQDSNTFQNFKKSFNDVERKVFMSGTPAPNRIEELYTVLNILSPVQFRTKEQYFTEYCGLEFRGSWMSNGERPKYEELYEAMGPFTYRKRKTDVLKDLPEKTYTAIYINLSDADMREYMELETGAFEKIDNLEDGGNQYTNALTILVKLRKHLSMLKTKYMKEVFDRILNEGDKLIVFDQFKDGVNALHEDYKGLSVLHTGDEKDSEKRAKMVYDFQNDDSVKMFLGTNATCKAGLTLTAANKLFLMTQPYSVGDNDQLADRCHRIGQKNACTIYIPVIKKTYDESVFYLVESKRSGLTKAIDNETYESNIMRVFIDNLLKRYKEKTK